MCSFVLGGLSLLTCDDVHRDIQVLAHAPPEVKALTDGNASIVWMSICAMLHLEETGEGWSEGSTVVRNADVSPEELAQRGLVAAIARLSPASAGRQMSGYSEEDTDHAMQQLQHWKSNAVNSLRDWRANRSVWAVSVMTGNNEGTVRSAMNGGAQTAQPESAASTIQLPAPLSGSLGSPAERLPSSNAGKRGGAMLRNAHNPPATLVEAVASSYASGYGKAAAIVVQAGSLLLGLAVGITMLSSSAATCCNSTREEVGCSSQPGTECDFFLMVDTSIGVMNATYSADTCRDLLSSDEWENDISVNWANPSALECADFTTSAIVAAIVGVIVSVIVKIVSALLFRLMSGGRLTPGWKSFSRAATAARSRGVKIYPAEFATLISNEGSPTIGMDVAIDKGAGEQHLNKVYSAASSTKLMSVAVRAIVAAVVLLIGLFLAIVSSFSYYAVIDSANDAAPMLTFGILLAFDLVLEALMYVVRVIIASSTAAKKVNRSSPAYFSWFEEYSDLSSMVGMDESYAKDMCHNIR